MVKISIIFRHANRNQTESGKIMLNFPFFLVDITILKWYYNGANNEGGQAR
jgi:hypothetical protein